MVQLKRTRQSSIKRQDIAYRSTYCDLGNNLDMDRFQVFAVGHRRGIFFYSLDVDFANVSAPQKKIEHLKYSTVHYLLGKDRDLIRQQNKHVGVLRPTAANGNLITVYF